MNNKITSTQFTSTAINRVQGRLKVKESQNHILAVSQSIKSAAFAQAGQLTRRFRSTRYRAAPIVALRQRSPELGR